MIAALKLLAVSVLLPLPSDTPPARRLPPPPPRELRAVEDVVLTARFPNGGRVPSTILLPQISNRADVIGFMRRNYPDSSVVQPRVIPVLWVYIDEQGGAYMPEVIVSSGSPPFDSLAIATVKQARFRPALVDTFRVPLWVMLPVQVAGTAMRPGNAPGSPGDSLPRFTPYTIKPELVNRDVVRRALVQNYPTELRDRRLSGTVLLWLLIDESGDVAKAQVKESSGHHELDQAAVRVGYVMRFTPARNRDQIVRVWISLPIVFKTR
jgi:TonB family protein